jgi:chromosomal replication initiator protein
MNPGPLASQGAGCGGDGCLGELRRTVDGSDNQIFVGQIGWPYYFGKVVRASNVKPFWFLIARNARGGQDVTKDDREIVSALRAHLADRVGKDRYEVWFGASTQLCVRDGTLTVGVPNRFYQDWLRNNFRKDIEAACIETLGQSLPLEFRIDASLATQGKTEAVPSSPLDGRAAMSEEQAADELGAERLATDGALVSGASWDGDSRQATAVVEGAAVGTLARSATARSGVPTGTARGPGMSAGRLALPGVSSSVVGAPRRRRFANLGSFVLGTSNRLAFTTAQMALARPGSVSPLLVYGPHGVGKTHLLEGIWSAFRRAHRQAGAIYLSAEQFTSYFLEALRGAGLPSFRRKYRDVELFILDDIQFFAGKRATLVELLHTVDTLGAAGKQLVFAADRSPAALKSLGPELAARLAGAMACRIEPPEYATRLAIVAQLATEWEIAIPPEVQAYVASHLTSQARELAGALRRLEATSLALGKPITLALAEEALGDLIHTSGRAVRLGDIEKAICDVFHLEPDSLQSDRKVKTVSHPRMLAMWLARKHTRVALSEIGHFFGRRSHSTVISAQKKVELWMAAGAPLDVDGRRCNVEDAIRRVEESLRAG